MKSRACCGIALALAVALMRPLRADSTPELRLQAKSAFRAGDYATASNLYQQIVTQNDEKPSLLKEAMWALWNMQHTREAAAAAQMVLKIAPNDSEAMKIAAWAPSAINKQHTHELQEAAKVAYRRGDNNQAIECYRQIAELNPRNVHMLQDYMWALWNANRVAPASEVARQLQILHPGDEEAADLLRKATSTVARAPSDRLDTLQVLQERIARNPSDIEAQRKLAWSAFNAHRYAEAARILKQLTEIKPNDSETWYQLGKTFYEIDNYPAAIDAFEHDLALNANQPRTLAALGKCYAQTRDLDQAVSYLSRAYGLSPNLPNFLPTFAKVLFYHGEFLRSKQIWTQALALEPTNVEYKYHEAEASYYAGQQVSALEQMRELVSTYNDKRARHFLIDEALSHNDTATATQLFTDEMRALTIEDEREVLRLCSLDLTLQRPDDALQVTRQWLKIFPEDVPVRLMDALALIQLKRYSEAIAILQRLLEQNPSNIDAQINLAEAYIGNGDSTDGINAFEKALALEPTNPYILHRHALAVFNSGQHDAARAELTNWLEANADHTVLPILLYHGLSPFEFAPMLAYQEHLTAVAFENQMQSLKQAGYHAITITQALNWYAGKTALPDKPVLITFDDARLDSFQYADDTLAHYGYTAAMFVPLDNIEHQGALGYAAWPTIRRYQQTGRWDIQSHGADAHARIPISAKGETAMFLTSPKWIRDQQRLETESEWAARVEADHQRVIRVIKEQTGISVSGYAYPEGLYGQQSILAAAVPLNVAAVKRNYQSAFIEDDYGMNLHTQDPNFLRRIEPKLSWGGPGLIKHLQDENPFAIIYNDLISMSLEENRPDEARRWLAQLQSAGASNEKLSIEQAKIEYASHHPDKAYELAMQTFVSDPSAENQALLTHFKPHSGIAWTPGVWFQGDNQHRQSWGFEQALDFPIGAALHARLIQGLASYKESGTNDVGDSVLGAGVTMEINERHRVDASLRHHSLSSQASDVWAHALSYQAQWAPQFSTRLDQVRDLYGSARAIDANIHEDRYRAAAHVGPTPDWGLSLRGRLSYLSDDNQRRTGEIELSWPFLRRIGLGAAYQYTYDDMKRLDDHYYSPRNLNRNLLGPQLSYGDHTPLKWLFQYLPGIAKEDGFPQQFVQNAVIQLDWTVRPATRLTPSINYEETPSYRYFLSTLVLEHEF